ncbi:Allergen V5/Tpx-1 family protein [Desulforamulus reducens MI-1]|uniref:Allergen V5/Tpx-1 family protein n=2 Tax=Desulforamulus TaxID=2916693 RepID=A4J4A1_DESRM|nr:Allergen V5/Tpx-1 family protein [Desulforamulus reducens MI-1]
MNVSVADEQAMLNLINKERAAAGLKPLAYDAKLTELARMKAQDMITNNYFSHTSPTYGSPFDMMKKFGVVYHYAGENLAGAADVNTAHVNLMNSPGHKANILKPEYTKVGIGVVKGGRYSKIFVQLFNG